MKRLAVLVLISACVLVVPLAGQAQGLQEHSLSDTSSATTPARPTQTAPQPVGTHPAPNVQAVQPSVQPGQPAAPVQQATPQQVPRQQAVQPQPVPRPDAAAGQYQAQPQYQPAPGPGGTPINGSTHRSLPPPPPPPPPSPDKTYSRTEINREVMGFFESGSRGLAQIVAKAFRDQGQPTGFIKGGEGGGALIVGLRYGSGTLYIKGQPPVKVYWQSPSVGFDLGVNVVKVFTLVYGMYNPDLIFQRFPGVDGSVYLIGGFGLNYQRSGPYTLAPIRFGVGLRLGANVGYQAYTRTESINPF